MVKSNLVSRSLHMVKDTIYTQRVLYPFKLCLVWMSTMDDEVIYRLNCIQYHKTNSQIDKFSRVKH